MMSNRENQSSRTKKSVIEVAKLSDTVKGDLTTEQLLLDKKKKECEEVEAEITKLQSDLIKAKNDEYLLSNEIIAIEKKLVVATQAKKDAKKGPAKDAAKAEEDRLTEEKKLKKAELAAVRADIKAKEGEQKTIEKEKTKKNTFIAGLLSKITILENKLTLAVQNELAKVHTKSTDVIQQISSWFSSKFTQDGKKVKGGSKSRQNKQKYQKRYTKRHNKKTYRKRTQKHLKIRRHKYTKRRK